jgi:hypothetical protein
METEVLCFVGQWLLILGLCCGNSACTGFIHVKTGFMRAGYLSLGFSCGGEIHRMHSLQNSPKTEIREG